MVINILVDDKSKIGLTSPKTDKLTFLSYLVMWLLIGVVPFGNNDWSYFVLSICYAFLLFFIMYLRFKDSDRLSKLGTKIVNKSLSIKNHFKVLLYAVLAIIVEMGFMLTLTALSQTKLESNNTGLILKLFAKQPAYLLYVCMIAPFLEELVFRQSLYRIITRWLEKHMDPSKKRVLVMIASLVVAMIFAVFHNDTTLVMYMLMSLYLQWIYTKERDIRVNMLVHAWINSLTFGLMLI